MQDRFAVAGGFGNASCAGNHCPENLITEMLTHFPHDQSGQVCPTVKHGHQNPDQFQPLVHAGGF